MGRLADSGGQLLQQIDGVSRVDGQAVRLADSDRQLLRRADGVSRVDGQAVRLADSEGLRLPQFDGVSRVDGQAGRLVDSCWPLAELMGSRLIVPGQPCNSAWEGQKWFTCCLPGSAALPELATLWGGVGDGRTG